MKKHGSDSRPTIFLEVTDRPNINLLKQIDIIIAVIQSHKGPSGNEVVDSFAKEALDIAEVNTATSLELNGM